MLGRFLSEGIHYSSKFMFDVDEARGQKDKVKAISISKHSFQYVSVDIVCDMISCLLITFIRL